MIYEGVGLLNFILLIFFGVTLLMRYCHCVMVFRLDVAFLSIFCLFVTFILVCFHGSDCTCAPNFKYAFIHKNSIQDIAC